MSHFKNSFLHSGNYDWSIRNHSPMCQASNSSFCHEFLQFLKCFASCFCLASPPIVFQLCVVVVCVSKRWKKRSRLFLSINLHWFGINIILSFYSGTFGLFPVQRQVSKTSENKSDAASKSTSTITSARKPKGNSRYLIQIESTLVPSKHKRIYLCWRAYLVVVTSYS